MNNLSSYTEQIIEIELSSKKNITGKLIDVGTDIVIIFNGQHFVYLPVLHILCMSKGKSSDSEFINDDLSPINKDGNLMSLRKILANASGIFMEIFLSGNHTVYGYITQIQDDYIVFDSPAFKTIYIPIAHIKWLIPYLNQTPYQIKKDQYTITPEEILAPTFEEQLKMFIEKMVIFDCGKDAQKIGIIKNVQNNFVELSSGDGQIINLNIFHLKCLHGV